MNIAKNMEGIFLLAAIAFTCASAFASSQAIKATTANSAAAIETSAVVIIPGKRMTAAEKAAFDL